MVEANNENLSQVYWYGERGIMNAIITHFDPRW
jgi:hypothetical protein